MISTVLPWRRAPTVPKAMPVSQTASAQPASISSIASGRASVVKSRSAGLATEQGVANAAADEVEPVPRQGEAAGELLGDGRDLHHLHDRILLGAHKIGGNGAGRQGCCGHGGPV